MSTYDIDTTAWNTFEDSTANAPDNLNNAISEIVSKFNAMIDETSGHYHDGADSRKIFGDLGNYTISEFAKAQIMGMFT